MVAKGFFRVTEKLDQKEVAQRNLGDDETLLCLGCGSGSTLLCICQNSWNCTPKRVNFTACKFEHNFKTLLKDQCMSVFCSNSLFVYTSVCQ